ncbi:hypothetical protein SD427_07225 [Chryseobacterium sp. JJR-5R]|uniref:hypothetical protein n=1 Tax=Chryseobacterium sp. JJR-5R TaxID=3093923 RepID=UPI002A74AE6F|nr:hypothetical protein [Chryseobacterium sp. JJR-5R]WPO84118.1 hypothetical protein SD427_07225 [Chryseobacterium sp. JJR-5R]
MKIATSYLLLTLTCMSSIAYSQVGIDTTTPQASLDVLGKSADVSAKDGIIAPRITKQQLASKTSGTYGALQNGTLLYVSDITAPTGTTPSLGQVANVNSIGYYYFNGSVWVNTGNTSTPVNIYNSNGTLTDNRTVTQNGNTLSFTGNTANAFSVDGNTFSVDAANDRIGIGTATPANKLHVNGTDPLRLEGITSGNSSTDRLLVADTNGVVKSIGSLGSLSVPTPAIFRLESAQTNFLNGVGAGASSVIPMTVVKNSIPGLTYNTGTSTITFPAGSYQMTVVYEATHNNTGCTLSSYIVDFPLNASTTRIHNTASHIEGNASNHGGTITYATTVPAGTNWQIRLGRGQSGNCSGTGMTLAANSTQLLVFRIGD